MNNSNMILPPNVLEIEEAIIGTLLIEKNAIIDSFHLLKPEYFYNNKTKVIFESIVNLYKKNIDIDLITVVNDIKNRNRLDTVTPYDISILTSKIGSDAHLKTHILILKQTFIRRELISSSNKIIEKCNSLNLDEAEIINFSEKSIFNVTSEIFSKECKSLAELLKEKTKIIIENQNLNENEIGLFSSFTSLDRKIKGFMPQNLILVAGRPSMGKTSLVVSMAYNLAVNFGKSIGIFSLEMSALQLTDKLIMQESNIPSENLKIGKLNQYEYAEYCQIVSNISNSNIFIDDEAQLSVLQIKSKARQMKVRFNIDMIIIDYLQLIHEKDIKFREQEISFISRNLKAIAKELNIPVIALSQLNRECENRPDKRPMLSDLRESGSLEQDADIVMFVHRPERYKMDFLSDNTTSSKDKAEIIIAKNRTGEIGDVVLDFDGSRTKFFENINTVIPF